MENNINWPKGNRYGQGIKKRHNNKSIYFKDWSTQKLKESALSYDELIYGEMPCYNSKDIMKLDGILNELHKRGIKSSNKLSFN